MWTTSTLRLTELTRQAVHNRHLSLSTVEQRDAHALKSPFLVQVDGDLNLIKGGGAAHTLEKVVGDTAKEFVILVDSTKIVEKLGSTFPVPVEVGCPDWYPARVIDQV